MAALFNLNFLTPGGPVQLGPLSWESANSILEEFRAAQGSEKKIFATSIKSDGEVVELLHVDCRAVYGVNMKRVTAQAAIPQLDFSKLLNVGGEKK